MVFAACGKKGDGEDVDLPKTLSSIVLNDPEAIRQDYKVGQTFQIDGLQIKLTYSDGSFELKDVERSWITGGLDSNGVLIVSGTQSFTITYEGKATIFGLTVEVADTMAPLLGITITQNPTKMTYAAGQLFNTTGMTVRADYSDGTSAVVTGWNWDKKAALAVGNTITVSYQHFGVEKTAIVQIEVKSIENYLKDFINGLIAEVPTEGAQVWWDTVVTQGANRFYTSLRSPVSGGGANMSDAQVLALLETFDEIRYFNTAIIENPFDVVNLFLDIAGTSIPHTAISNFLWFLVAVNVDILETAEQTGALPIGSKGYYDEIYALGRLEFVKAFNALLELAHLFPSISGVINKIGAISENPSLAEFRDIVMPLRADTISAAVTLTPEVMSAFTSLAKVFIPLATNDAGEQQLAENLVKEFNDFYPVIRNAWLAALNAAGSTMVDRIHAHLVSIDWALYDEIEERDGYYGVCIYVRDNRMCDCDWNEGESCIQWFEVTYTTRQIKEESVKFFQGITNEIIDAVLAANLGTCDYAVTYKAILRLGRFFNNVNAITTGNEDLSKKSLGEVQTIVAGLRNEALAALDAIQLDTVNAVSRLIKNFVPYFMQESEYGLVFDLMDEILDPSIFSADKTAWIAVITRVDNAMVAKLYDHFVTNASANTTIAYVQAEYRLIQEIVDDLVDAALGATYVPGDYVTTLKVFLGLAKSYSRIGTTLSILNAEIFDGSEWVVHEPTEQEWKDAVWLIRNELINVLTAFDIETLESVINLARNYLRVFGEVEMIDGLIELFLENKDIYTTVHKALLAGVNAVTRPMLDEIYDNIQEQNNVEPVPVVYPEHIKIRLIEDVDYIVRPNGYFNDCDSEGDNSKCGCDWSLGQWCNQWFDLPGFRYLVEVEIYDWWNYMEGDKFYIAVRSYGNFDFDEVHLDGSWYVVIEYGIGEIVIISWHDYHHYGSDYEVYNPLFLMLEVVTPAHMNTILTAMIDSIKNDNNDFAKTFAAFLRLGQIGLNVEGIVQEIISIEGEPTLADIKRIVKASQEELLAVLNLLDGPTVKAMTDLMGRFMPYFLGESKEAEIAGYLNKVNEYYPMLNKMLLAMVNAVDPDAPDASNIVTIVYNNLDAFTGEDDVSDDFIIALAKVVNAGLTATGGANNEKAFDIATYVLNTVGIGIPDEIFDGRDLETFINNLYDDVGLIAMLPYGTILDHDDNLLVMLVKAMFTIYEVETIAA